MRYKKYTAICLLATALCIWGLTGCGSSGSNSGAGDVNNDGNTSLLGRGSSKSGSTSCLPEMQSAVFDDFMIQIDGQIYRFDEKLQPPEIFTLLDRSKKGYSISHNLGSLLGSGEKETVTVSDENGVRFEFDVKNYSDETAELKDCKLVSFNLNQENASDIYLPGGYAADGSNYDYKELKEKMSEGIEKGDIRESEGGSDIRFGADHLTHRMMDEKYHYLMDCSYMIYVDKVSAQGKNGDLIVETTVAPIIDDDTFADDLLFESVSDALGIFIDVDPGIIATYSKDGYRLYQGGIGGLYEPSWDLQYAHSDQHKDQVYVVEWIVDDDESYIDGNWYPYSQYYDSEGKLLVPIKNEEYEDEDDEEFDPDEDIFDDDFDDDYDDEEDGDYDE